MGQKEFNNQKKETPMKKEYMAPEMEVVEMDYEIACCAKVIAMMCL